MAASFTVECRRKIKSQHERNFDISLTEPTKIIWAFGDIDGGEM